MEGDLNLVVNRDLYGEGGRERGEGEGGRRKESELIPNTRCCYSYLECENGGGFSCHILHGQCVLLWVSAAGNTGNKAVE